MTDFDTSRQLSDIACTLARLTTCVETLEKTLNGNGHPGIVQRHEVLEKKIAVLNEWREQQDKRIGRVIQWIGIILSALISVLAYIRK